VRFVYESFRKLRPGTPLRCLHGGMKQGKRLGVFEAFNAPSSGGGGGVLFATDIAARGLDFPDVDWVVQADCPEDVAAYIHRYGVGVDFLVIVVIMLFVYWGVLQ
jgi:ATP-dependent RNA helicase DDX10/DBP4